LTRAELGADIEKLDAEIARLRGRQRKREMLSLETLWRGMSGWAAAFARGTRERREVLGVLFEYVEPIKLGRGRYEVRTSWTALGKQVCEAAAVLTGSENLVSLDHLGRTRLSTPTIPPTPAHALARTA
jgi:hypothetical protein